MSNTLNLTNSNMTSAGATPNNTSSAGDSVVDEISPTSTSGSYNSNSSTSTISASGSSSGQFQPSSYSSHSKPSSNKKSKFPMVIIIVLILLFLVLPFITVVGGGVLVAQNYGKDNALGKLNAVFSVKDLPAIGSLAPSDTEVLQRAMKSTSDGLIDYSSGLEFNSNLNSYTTPGRVNLISKFDFDGELNGLKSSGSLKLSTGSESNSDNSKSRLFGTVDANINAGIISIETGDKPISYEVLASQEDSSKVFIKLDMSDELLEQYIDLIERGAQSSGLDMEDFPLKADQILGKYFKIDIDKLNEGYAEIYLTDEEVPLQEELSKEKIEKIQNFVNKYISQPLSVRYEEQFISKLDEMGEVNKVERTKFNDITVDVYEHKIDGKKFFNSMYSVINEFVNKDVNEEFIVELCKVVAITDETQDDEDCDNIEDIDEGIEEIQDEFNKTKEESYDSFEEFLEYVDIKSTKYYVDPTNNDVVYSELNLSLTEKGFDEINVDGTKITKLDMVFGVEYMQDFELKYNDPKDANDLTQDFLDYFELLSESTSFESSSFFVETDNEFDYDLDSDNKKSSKEDSLDSLEIDSNDIFSYEVGDSCSGFDEQLDTYSGEVEVSEDDADKLVCIYTSPEGEKIILDSPFLD